MCGHQKLLVQKEWWGNEKRQQHDPFSQGHSCGIAVYAKRRFGDNREIQSQGRLPRSSAVSKPDAPAELVEKVLDGDITTNAEYIKLKAELDRTREECRQIDANSAAKDKEYERELKEANRRAENAERDNKKSTARLAAEVTKANELERRIKELESRPVDVAVQQDAELLEELEELREENARLKDDSVKSMVIRLTLDEYDKLLDMVNGDPCLGHIIKHAKIIKL